MHKVILVSCSDYFRSMFTSGMKESTQREIELKGITARGLEKVLEVIYTSTTSLEGDDIFDVIGAAMHLQVDFINSTAYRNFNLDQSISLPVGSTFSERWERNPGCDGSVVTIG